MRGTSVQKEQAVKRLLSQLEANLWRFAAVKLLRNKHQHQKKLAPKSGHAKEWTRVNCKLTIAWHLNS